MRARNGTRKLLVILVILFGAASFNSAEGAGQGKAPVAIWTVNLRSYGWRGPIKESNREFFKDFTQEKLASVDIRTRLLFVSNDVLVAYHTRADGRDWRTAKRWLDGFFLKAEDGSLLARRQWPSVLRKDGSDAESEARIVALRNGEFVVIADGVLMLYSDNLRLIGKHKLEPFGPRDMWGISRVAAGREIFLRHEILSTRMIRYQWLDADTFKPLVEMTGDIMWGRGMNAVADGVLDGGGRGVYLRRPLMPEEMVCDAPFCRVPASGFDTVITSQLIGLIRSNGIGVLDVGHGLSWSDVVDPENNHYHLQFGEISPSLSGNRFAVWITAGRRYVFNSVELLKGPNPNVLVFDTLKRKHIFATTIRSQTFEWTFALSPDGTKLATFDGVTIALYRID
ncbi:MAG TPA: hypothetical protein VND90_01865 [Terracidiphilus sp.]|nr:hypothetical protein [Terracidiphilus sp.]